ncbi:MAG: hypothetical protein EOM91_20705 [Sphingobacteriia bacterium]|nr:hypothetical protein [Sphingobacteriia bacterium]
MKVQIDKTQYTKFVDASVDAFTAQCRGADGWEVLFATSKPAPDTDGVIVPPGLPYGLTRSNGVGNGWAKLPANASAQTADVVVT